MAQNACRVLANNTIVPTSNNDKFFIKYNDVCPEHAYKHLCRVKRFYVARNFLFKILKQVVEMESYFEIDGHVSGMLQKGYKQTLSEV